MTEVSGIDHQFMVYEGLFGGGVCVLDINNDGWEDLYITAGVDPDQLYVNEGNGTFTNRFEGSGLEKTNHYATLGVASADVNRDGWIDLFITTITTTDSVKLIPREKNLLFLNNGDGTFRDVTAAYKLNNLYSFSTGPSFGDINSDGYPDAYVGNYFLEYDGPLTEIKDETIVNANRTAKDYLLINIKGRYFKNQYRKYGLTHRGFGFGGLFTDFDNDSDLDIYVHNDFGYKSSPNYLLQNNFPDKSFDYVEEELKMDLKINAMGAAVGDYNQDGYLEYFVSDIKFNHFMVRTGGIQPIFENKAEELGLITRYSISWGANFEDFDNDGDLDLYVSNGDLNPNCTPMGNFLFEYRDGKFAETSRESGVQDFGMGRGSAVFDFDNDGDMDIITINQVPIKAYPVESRSRLFRNDTSPANWLGVALRGKHSTTRGLGSRVQVFAGQTIQIREIDGGNSSHMSQNSSIAHFGLGALASVDSVVVSWIGGGSQTILYPKINTILQIVQEEDTPKNISFIIAWVIGLAAILTFLIIKIKR